MATASQIGTTIKKRRQVLGMTQEDLARELGVSKSTVANWEGGKHFPLRHLGAVEAVLGMSLTEEPEELEPRDDFEREVLAQQEGRPPGWAARMIKLYREQARKAG